MQKDWYTSEEALAFLGAKLKRTVSLDELINQILSESLSLYIYPIEPIKTGNPNIDLPWDIYRLPQEHYRVHTNRSRAAIKRCLSSFLGGQMEHFPSYEQDTLLHLVSLNSGSVVRPHTDSQNSLPLSLTEHVIWQFKGDDLCKLLGVEADSKVSPDKVGYNSLTMLVYLLAMKCTEGDTEFREGEHGMGELNPKLYAEKLAKEFSGIHGTGETTIYKALSAGHKVFKERG